MRRQHPRVALHAAPLTWSAGWANYQSSPEEKTVPWQTGSAWFESVPEYKYYSKRYNCETNFYRVKAGQDQTFWEEKGWINPQDPRGWFQWYTRFFLGRRTEDDARQISRWKGVTGSKGRWKRFLLNKIVAANAHLDDYSVSPVVRQTLLHWAYEVTPKDMKVHLSRMK